MSEPAPTLAGGRGGDRSAAGPLEPATPRPEVSSESPGERKARSGSSGGRQGAGLVGPILLFLFGAALTLLAARAVAERADRELEQQTQAFASVLAGEVESRMTGRLAALARRLERGAAAGYDGAWRSEAELFVHESPGFVGIARVTPAGGRVLVAAEPHRGAAQEAAAQIAASSDATGVADAAAPASEVLPSGAGPLVATRTIRLTDGRPLLALAPAPASPVPPDLVAFLDPAAALGWVLQRRAPGHVLEVEGVDGTPLYERNGDPGAVDARFTKRQAIRTGLGAPWQLVMQPSSERVRSAEGQATEVVLGAGLLISALVAALAHVAQLAGQRARALEGLNAQLAAEVSSSRRGADEIRELNELLEARVRERTAELQETIVELETFNYSVSHDLRSPLGAIINLAAILSEDYEKQLDADGRGYLRRIVASATNAVSLMDALLAFSRSGRAEMHLAPVPMRALFESVAQDLRASAAGPAPSIRVLALPNALADAVMTRFVATSLLGNACKFVRPGDTADVEVGGWTENGESVYYVRDHGIGFDMRYADKLFKVFERLHAQSEFRGHGIALAIVARMIRRHGGRVWARGAADEGATFYFSLPSPAGPDAARAEQ